MKTIALVVACTLTSAGASHKFDVVVYGGTAGGVMGAVSAAREGLKTALVSPGHHVGGMVSGGLGHTDFGKKEVIGGYALEFYHRVGMHYGQEVAWYHEPHVAEDIFRQMLKEAGVIVFSGTGLQPVHLETKDATISEISTQNGDSFAARIFIDSSYEGDLMAQA